MSRPRKRDKHLPAYVRIRNGSYLYKDRKLCRVEDGEAAMYEALAKFKVEVPLDMVPAAVAAFKIDYLKHLAASSKKEHGRLLDIFANEFSEYRLDQVTAATIKRSIRQLYGDKLTAAGHYKARISTFFRWCVTEMDLLAINPCREITLKKAIPKKTPWTDELFHACREKLSPMLQCYHDLSFLLLNRTTDVRRLKWSQVGDKHIRFAPSKTAKSSGLEVDVPRTKAIDEVLERALSLATIRPLPGGDAFVIQGPGGSPYTRSGIHSAYRKADKALHSERVGLNPKALLPYAMQAAKRLRGYSNEQLKTARAHTSITTTEGYMRNHEVAVSEVEMCLPPRP